MRILGWGGFGGGVAEGEEEAYGAEDAGDFEDVFGGEVGEVDPVGDVGRIEAGGAGDGPGGVVAVEDADEVHDHQEGQEGEDDADAGEKHPGAESLHVWFCSCGGVGVSQRRQVSRVGGRVGVGP